MKKHLIFLLSVILTLNCVILCAQNPFCTLKGNPFVGNNPTSKEIQYERQKSYRSEHFDGEKCSFRLRLQDPLGGGWLDVGIKITVDGVDYGIVSLSWGGGGYGEEIKLLPSGEIQFKWLGEFDPVRHCFEIYNSLEELIYKSPYMGEFDPLFLIYQNECVECVPLTDFEGVYIPEEQQVNLSWVAPESDYVLGIDIYRNDALIDHLSHSTVFYSDYTAELEDGNYRYCVIPVYPSVCTLEEECFETPIINEGIVDYKDNIIIYPNPANNVINIIGDKVSNLKMYNNIGQLILTQHNTNTINVNGLTDGLYLLTIELSTGHTTQKKLIINH